MADCEEGPGGVSKSMLMSMSISSSDMMVTWVFLCEEEEGGWLEEAIVIQELNMAGAESEPDWASDQGRTVILR